MANCSTERGGLGKAKRFLLLNKISKYFGEKVCQFILFLVSNNNELYKKMRVQSIQNYRNGEKWLMARVTQPIPLSTGLLMMAIAVRSAIAKV